MKITHEELRKHEALLKSQYHRAVRNKSGFRGVQTYGEHLTRRFRAVIYNRNRQICLGYYVTAQEAHEVYVAAKKIFHREMNT